MQVLAGLVSAEASLLGVQTVCLPPIVVVSLGVHSPGVSVRPDRLCYTDGVRLASGPP